MADLGVVAHDEVPELHDLVVDGGAVPLLDDVVGCPLLPLLHHAARPHHAHASDYGVGKKKKLILRLIAITTLPIKIGTFKVKCARHTIAQIQLIALCPELTRK